MTKQNKFILLCIILTIILPNTYLVTVIKKYDEDVCGTIERSRRKSKSAENLVIFSLRQVGRLYDYKIYHGRVGSQNCIMKLC